MKSLINKKTQNIFKKILNININKKNYLEKKISDICDSLKYMELLAEIEKKYKINLSNKKIDKVKDINNLLNG